MAKDDMKGGMCACGMHLCGKCSMAVLIFGLIWLIAGLGLWNPGAWFNGWTILGAFAVVWGAGAMMKM